MAKNLAKSFLHVTCVNIAYRLLIASGSSLASWESNTISTRKRSISEEPGISDAPRRPHSFPLLSLGRERGKGHSRLFYFSLLISIYPNNILGLLQKVILASDKPLLKCKTLAYLGVKRIQFFCCALFYHNKRNETNVHSIIAKTGPQNPYSKFTAMSHSQLSLWLKQFCV